MKKFFNEWCGFNSRMKKILLAMKLTIIAFFLGLISLSASTYSQNTKITLDLEGVTLFDVFKQIESQSEFVFIYKSATVDFNRRVNVKVEETTVDKILENVLKDSGIKFEINKKQIILTPDRTIPVKIDKPVIKAEMQQPQKKEITGAVKDSKGLALPGVTVVARGTTSGTITDGNGYFKLSVPRESKTILISFVGMKSQEVIVNEKPINIIMEEETYGLEDVVVVGYGKVLRADMTGAISEIKVNDVAKAPVMSFTEALGGRVSGIQISSSDGQPGSTPDIIIRGAGSLTQSTSPLYVVDGFPMEDFNPNSISQNDIESINILKDASATSIYGARAANGVVLIETKKGKSGRTIIEFNTSVGYQQLPKKLEVMSPYEFVKYHSELKPSTTSNMYFKDGKTLEDYRNVQGIDWQDILFRKGTTQIYNLSVRGGNEKTKFSISGNLYDGGGVLINTGSKRYQGRVNLDHEVSKKLRVGVNINRSYTDAYGVPASVGPTSSSTSLLFYNAWGYRPVSGNENVDLINDDVDPEVISTSEMRINPQKTAENTYRKFYGNTMTTVGYLDFSFTKNLKLRMTGNLYDRDQQDDAFYNSLTPQGSAKNPNNIRGVNGQTTRTSTFTWSNENVLTYSKVFNKVHKLNLISGFSSQSSKRSAKGVSSMNIPNEELGMAGLDQGTPYASVASASKYTLASYFGRIHYNHKSRYTLEGTLRADGSSKFAKGHKWGYFPSGSVSWNVKSEPWLEGFKTISTMKLRASYGITGNNRVGDFSYMTSLDFPTLGYYSFNNEAPVKSAIPILGNKDLSWEPTSQIDAGIDIGLIKEKIGITVDYYKKNTRNLLLYADIPLTTGFDRIYRNIGELENEGLEISLNTVNIATKRFRWESNFNISFNRNRIVSLVENQTNLFTFYSFETQYNTSPLYIARVGESAANFYGFVFDGVYQYSDFNDMGGGRYNLKPTVTTNGDDRSVIQPGDIKYKDLNGDGVVNSYDQTIIGSGIPLHVGGFNNNFTYGNVSLGIFFQWSYGNDIMNANRLVLEGNGLQRTAVNQFASYADRWSPENQTNRNYRAGGQGPLGRYSSRTLEDGSYLRLKTLSFRYSLPKKLVKRFSMSKLELTVAGQNLITWDNYSGWDPEVSVRSSVLTPGFDYSAYPQAKTLLFGLNASF